jgi:hypothetical protein
MIRLEISCLNRLRSVATFFIVAALVGASLSDAQTSNPAKAMALERKETFQPPRRSGVTG